MRSRTRARRFGNMPVVYEDRKYNLKYSIFYNELHGPHVCVFTGRYGSGYSANVSLWDLSVMDGELPGPLLRRAQAFVGAHLGYFRRAWDAAKEGKTVQKLRAK